MLLKRTIELVLSFIGLVFTAPLLVTFMVLIFLKDKKNPVYSSLRVGHDGNTFSMLKLRTMVYDADKSGVFSTSDGDKRITDIGRFLRRTKLDELPQLLNILNGTMSFVGPRANVISEVELYTAKELKLLSVRPGLTDFASIVYSNEGNILAKSQDADNDYRNLIWPGKSKLGLFYIENQSFYVDFMLVLATCISLFSRTVALYLISQLMKKISADPSLIELVSGDNIIK